jgi:hypothetical protein
VSDASAPAVIRRLRLAWPTEGGAAALPAAVAGIVTVVAWPIASVPANQGIDRSWQIALHLGADLHLRQGVDFVFTYGPLGFLGFPHPYLGITSSIALVGTIVVYFALVATMLIEARRSLPLWAAAIVTLLVARFFVLLPPWEALLALVALWCIEALTDRIPLPTSAIAAVGGVIAGVAALGKLNVGVFVFALGAATAVAIGRPWWKALAVYLASATASGIGLWLLAGQRLTDIGAYISGAYQIIRGYGEAMGLDVTPQRAWVYLALAGGAVILAWAGWQSSQDWPRSRRIGLLGLGLVFGFAIWKLIIVREHGTFAMLTMTVVAFAFAGRVPERRAWLVSVLALAIGFAGISAIEPPTYLNLVGSVRSIATEASKAFIPGRADRAAVRTREQLRSAYRLEPSILTALTGRTVHIDPWEAGVAYAYPEVRWAPLPVFQSYSAYTPLLDELNADRLRSAQAPDRILRQFRRAVHNDRLRLQIGRPVLDGEELPFTVDGRFRWFEAPATTLETFCRYAQIAVSGTWEVLARTGRSCGAPEPLTTLSAPAGGAVEVPVEARPDRFVIVRVGGLEPSALGQLREAIAKAPDWYVTLDGARYRLVPGTAADGLLVAVPPAADGTGPFAFGRPIRTIAIAAGPNGRDSAATLTYEFLSVPLAGS